MARENTQQVAYAIEVFMRQNGFTPFRGSTNWASDTVETVYQAVTEPERVYLVNVTQTGQDWRENRRRQEALTDREWEIGMLERRLAHLKRAEKDAD